MQLIPILFCQLINYMAVLQVISSNQLAMYSNSCLLLRIHLNRFGAPQGEELPDVPLAKELPDVPLAEELV